MIQHASCQGCGSSELSVSDAYAAVEGPEEVEIVELRCARCGRLEQATRRVA